MRRKSLPIEAKKWDGEFGLSRPVGHHPCGLSRCLENSPLGSKACKDVLADRGYSIIGPADVIEAEIGPSRQLTSAATDPAIKAAIAARPDLEIPPDLSIPIFLRRLP
jgi:hypothetical protein